MKEDLWSRFVHSGKVEDYLAYIKHEEDIETSADENHNEWLSHKGTDNRGE